MWRTSGNPAWNLSAVDLNVKQRRVTGVSKALFVQIGQDVDIGSCSACHGDRLGKGGPIYDCRSFELHIVSPG